MDNFPIPNEILIEITEHLSGSDLVSLSATCKTLRERIEGILFGTKARSQRYYTSFVELQRLVRFSRHPRGATLFLKKLVLDLFCPYFYDIIGPFSLENIVAAKLVLLDYCNTERKKYAGEISYRAKLLAAALQNLPSLEVVEFVITLPKDMPRRTVRKHFSDMKFRPVDFETFYKNYIQHARWNRDIDFIPAQIIDAVVNASLPSLTTIWANVRAMDRYEGYRSCSLPISWFTEKVHHHLRYRDKFAGLRDLKICVESLSKDNGRSPGGMIGKIRIDELQAVTLFLNDMVPNLETLHYSSSSPPSLDSWNGTEMTWPASMDRFHTKWIYWFPGIHIDQPKLFLPNLKILQFRCQAFIIDELISFLRAHRTTLRKVTLRSSVAEAKYQHWLPVFQLLENEMKLETFLFDGLYSYLSYGAVPWFEMSGNLSLGDDSNICELIPGLSIKMDLKTALKMIEKLEESLEGRTRATNGKWVWDPEFCNIYFGNGRITKEDEELEEKLRFDENFYEHAVFGRKKDFWKLQIEIRRMYSQLDGDWDLWKGFSEEGLNEAIKHSSSV
ncbi:hypothetical protein AA313_de0208599 [Arthrobotrys entomopaga]|nr:hypothetical protein AA313_de0208599 [Arthrobotrys entomopaga]